MSIRSNAHGNIVLRTSRTDTMQNIALTAVLMMVFSNADAYDTGSLTCPRIGDLAAETIVAKRDGATADSQLAKLIGMFEADAAIERKLVTNIVHTLYENELLEAMQPADAYMVFMGDCIRGREQSPRGGGEN
jgi:hypothetical protein